MNIRRIMAFGLATTFAAVASFATLASAAETSTYVGADYVGSEKCQECHQKEYWGWKETLHAYKVQEASPRTVVADFYKNNTLTIGEYTSKMTEKNGKYSITTLDNEGNENTYPIKYTIGGNQWKQRFMTEFPNGGLHILPVQWNIETRQWVDYHGLAKRKPGEKGYWAHPGRTWNMNCSGCHTTGVKINFDESNKSYKTTWVDEGAGCESCHGPGSNHVNAPDKERFNTIVNPDKLNFSMGVQVCGSCHTRGKSLDGKHGFPNGFRPGIGAKRIEYLYDPVEPGGKRFWMDSDDSKSHHQQFLDYEQTQHAAAGVACWDCHSVHGNGMANKFQLKQPGSTLCVSCHGTPKIAAGKGGLSHSIHDFGNCVGCHMPPTAKTAVSGDIRSHRFDVLTPNVSIKAMVTKAAKGDKKVLAFFGLQPSDVAGKNAARVEAKLKSAASVAQENGKSFKNMLFGVQPNSCNGCHYHETTSPWALDEEMKKTRRIQAKR